ncbi:MAG: aminoacyl-tRNA hydrolase [Bacteroidota bacterium]
MPAKYLIAGLGNIGPDYHVTRHNIGFMALDRIAEKYQITFQPARYGDITTFRFKGRMFFLLKPSTYMNLSGKAINYWINKENIELNNLLVITDDVALPLATLRLKGKGSDGGHNGLSNINTVLGTQNYARLRFGIGDNYPRGHQVDYVLGKWTDAEKKIINPVLDTCKDLVESFGTIGLERTMNIFNTSQKKLKKDAEKPTSNKGTDQ